MFAELLLLSLANTPSPPSSCDWATAADAHGLRVRSAGGAESTETSTPKYDDPKFHDFEHMFYLEVTREARGPKCLLVRWRAVPRGNRPATAADFFGGRWPSGTIQLPAWPTARELNPPMVEIRFNPRDDGIDEPNETLGVELLNQRGRVIWGSETWAPQIAGRSLLWNNDDHRTGAVLTIHDAGHQCLSPGPLSGFSIVNKREMPEGRQYYEWPGIFVERPDRPITQCETVRWRLAAGGARSLRATDFRKGVFPSGTLRFSSDASGDPDGQDDSFAIQFAPRRGLSGRGRTVRIILESKRGIVTQRVVTLD